MIKRFLCYVSEFFYHTLTPVRVHLTRIIIYHCRTLLWTHEEPVRRRRIGQSADSVRGAALSAPPTPAEETPEFPVSPSLAPSHSSYLDFATRSPSQPQVHSHRLPESPDVRGNCCAYRCCQRNRSVWFLLFITILPIVIIVMNYYNIVMYSCRLTSTIII